MQSVSSRIWTRVAVSISYDDNDYTTFDTLPYNADLNKKASSTIFESLEWLDLGLNPGLWRTL